MAAAGDCGVGRRGAAGAAAPVDPVRPRAQGILSAHASKPTGQTWPCLTMPSAIGAASADGTAGRKYTVFGGAVFLSAPVL